MYTKLNSIKFALAGALTMLLAQIIGHIFIRLSLLQMQSTPEFMQNLATMQRIYSFPGIVITMITSFISGFAMTWLFAFIYNWLLKK